MAKTSEMKLAPTGTDTESDDVRVTVLRIRQQNLEDLPRARSLPGKLVPSDHGIG